MVRVSVLAAHAFVACQGCFSSASVATTPEQHAALQALAYRDHSRGGIFSGGTATGDDRPPSAGANQLAAVAAPAPFVTAGGVSQQYEVLGPVHINTRGVVNVGSVLGDALFKSRIERAVGGATPTIRQDEAFDQLLAAAVAQHGPSVSAVINATYRAEHGGTVYADGLAVRFVTPAPQAVDSARRDAATRLENLEDLREQKLITQKEYEKKRAEIIGDL